MNDDFCASSGEFVSLGVTAYYIKQEYAQDANAKDAKAKTKLILTINPSLLYIKDASSGRNYRRYSMIQDFLVK